MRTFLCHFYRKAQNAGKSRCRYLNSAHALWFTKPSTNCCGCFCVFISHFWKAGGNWHRWLLSVFCRLCDWGNSSVWFCNFSSAVWAVCSFSFVTSYCLTKFLCSLTKFSNWFWTNRLFHTKAKAARVWKQPKSRPLLSVNSKNTSTLYSSDLVLYFFLSFCP